MHAYPCSYSSTDTYIHVYKYVIYVSMHVFVCMYVYVVHITASLGVGESYLISKILKHFLDL